MLFFQVYIKEKTKNAQFKRSKTNIRAYQNTIIESFFFKSLLKNILQMIMLQMSLNNRVKQFVFTDLYYI